MPSVNQVEFNPYHQQKAIRAIMAENNVQLEAWGPLGQGNKDLIVDPVINRGSISSWLGGVSASGASFHYRDFLSVLEGKYHLVIIDRDLCEASSDAAFIEDDEWFEISSDRIILYSPE